MLNYIYKILYVIILLIIIFYQRPLYSQTLDIQTKEECESIGGVWNECPPNECQKSQEYKNGKIICPQVCGDPICEGIIPKEENDLSEIHNANLLHMPIIRGEEETKKNNDKPNKDIKDGLQSDNSQDNIKSVYNKDNKFLFTYTIIGIILLLLFYIIKKVYKK